MRSALLLLVIGCRTPTAPAPEAPVKPHVWVDGSAAEGGNGSQEHPLRALEPLAGTVTHLATGLYRFSGALPEGAELVGGKAVVLYAEGDAPVVVEAGAASLRELAIQGGQVGLKVNGAVVLENVSFSGQRQVAIEVPAGGALKMTGGVIEGTVSETRGVAVRGRADLQQVAMKGALRRGVEVTQGEATVVDVDSRGPNTVVQVTGGRAVCARVKAAAGRGPAFFASGAALELHDVTVVGHEYAVLTGPRAEVKIEGLTSDQAMFGALGLLLTNASVKRLTVTRPGPHGALESLEGVTKLEDARVSDAQEIAVLVRHGRLEATRLKVNGVRGGDGVMVRDATAKLVDLELSDLDGAGVIATAVATVEVDGLTCTGCAHGALIVERMSKVKAKRVVSQGSREAAVTVPDDGQLELEGLEVRGEGPAVWAECAAGSSVVLSGKLPPRELMSGRCIELKASHSGK